MKPSEITAIEKMLEIMVTRLRSNADEIHKNAEEMKRLNKKSSHQDEIDKLQVTNKGKLQENMDILGIQKSVMDYMSRYKAELYEFFSNTLTSAETELSLDAMFELTITGELPLDENHPGKKNKDLLDRLLEHYIHIEDYEQCKFVKNFMPEEA